MIVITAEVHGFLLDEFAERKIPVKYVPKVSYEELLPLLKEADALVITTRIRIDENLLQSAPHLRWIGRLGSGLELIDRAGLQQRGIHFISTPEGNCNSVAEQNLGTLLSIMHRIQRSAREVKNYTWLRNENRGTELSGKTVGIYGYGHTGSAFARLLQPFGCTVLAFDKYKSGFGQTYIQEAQPEQIAAQADIISFHLPLTDETRNLANEAFFNSLARTPIILNTSRGGIINTTALISALEKEQIVGAGLDVLENEKIETLSESEKKDFEYLTSHPNVIVTPHIAGYSHEAFYKMSAILIKKLSDLQLI